MVPMIGFLGVCCLGKQLLYLSLGPGWWLIVGCVGNAIAGCTDLGYVYDGRGLKGNGIERSPSRLIRSRVLFTTENTSNSGSTSRSVPLVALVWYLSNNVLNDTRSLDPFTPNGFSPDGVVALSENLLKLTTGSWLEW